MRKLRIGIIDLVSRAPTRALYARVMHANLASIMPQVIAVWCEEQGHQVHFVCYTGLENLAKELPEDSDLIFIGAFTQAAQLAYALSNLFRSRGAVTVLGGPHARSYPEDSQQYFDYVLGFTDRSVIRNVLQDCSQHGPPGLHLSAPKQPPTLPTLRQRWKFIEPTLRKAPLLKIVPMLSSLGCPYSCDFCIDSQIPYQALELDVIKEDLRFLKQVFRRPRVAWHDPNFGVRFDEHMTAIEEAIPPNSIDFIAESTLSLLSESRLKRLKRNGFKALLPGVESWFDLGNKSKSGTRTGMEKVKQVSEKINTMLRYIPYVQVNFVVGLDADKGSQPFELTKRFIDMTPGAFPGYSLLSAFGRSAPVNLEYQRSSRVLPFPFHFLDNNQAMNVRPKNYTWPDFYDHLINLSKHTFSWRAIANRFMATSGIIPRWMNFVRGVSTEGFGRIAFFREVRRLLDTDHQMRKYFEQETTQLPLFYKAKVQRDLGPFWEFLPRGALHHDPHAYLKSEKSPRSPQRHFV
jgi:hypothetical protein